MMVRKHISYLGLSCNQLQPQSTGMLESTAHGEEGCRSPCQAHPSATSTAEPLCLGPGSPGSSRLLFVKL